MAGAKLQLELYLRLASAFELEVKPEVAKGSARVSGTGYRVPGTGIREPGTACQPIKCMSKCRSGSHNASRIIPSLSLCPCACLARLAFGFFQRKRLTNLMQASFFFAFRVFLPQAEPFLHSLVEKYKKKKGRDSANS